MKRFRNMFWLLIIPVLAFGIHKHYISLTKIDYIKEQKTVQITMKFYLDDIELALENRIGEPMELERKMKTNWLTSTWRLMSDENLRSGSMKRK